MRLRAFIGSLLFVVASFAFAQGTAPAGAQPKTVAQITSAAQCKEYRTRSANTSLFAEEMQKGVEMWCTCVPAEVKRLGDGANPSASKEEQTALSDKAIRTCGGKQLREEILAQCPRSGSHADCGCAGSVAFNMGDEQLFLEADTAYQAQVAAARARGLKPGASLSAAAIRQFRDRCDKPAQ